MDNVLIAQELIYTMDRMKGREGYNVLNATSITAKFWALRDGLKLALNEGIQRLIVELDAKVVVDRIKSNTATKKLYAPLLYDCRCLLTRFIQVQVTHVYIEGNRCANALARWGSNMVEAFAIFDSPPSSDVVYLVNMDNVGMFLIGLLYLILTLL